jgi:Phage integrase, N-terminal SAM-like domain
MAAPRRHPGIRWHHGKYQVRYRDSLGVQRAQPFDRLTDAKDFQAELRTRVNRGEWIDPETGRELFEDYAARWFESTAHLRAGTREKVAGHLRNHILPTFRAARLADIQPAHGPGLGCADGGQRSLAGHGGERLPHVLEDHAHR